MIGMEGKGNRYNGNWTIKQTDQTIINNNPK
jgi:hypothetical protein